MKKKLLTILITIALILTAFTGCLSSEAAGSDEVAVGSTSSTSVGVLNDEEITSVEVDYSDLGIDDSYDIEKSTIIMLNNDNTTVDGSGASYKDGVLNIINAGTYILSGSLHGQVIVEATSVDEVQLVLNNAEIINNQGTAIYSIQAEALIITLAEGSVNTIEDSTNYSDTSSDSPDAAIFSGDDLIINGSGTLNVVGSYKHGIKSADDITIISGKLNVKAANDGIRGKDSVAVQNGYLTIDAQGDGLTATNSNDAEKGWISIDGGKIVITARNNGLQAESALVINSGELNITASQDTYHCNKDITITGGTSILNAGDDGMHADSDLQISEGTIDVVSNYEGIEGSNVYITGGSITIEAVDDGINAAGGSDSDAPKGDRFSEESGENVISITDGHVYVSIVGNEGDGLDSNGNIYLSGGTVIIDGGVSERDAAIDINKGIFEYSGGTLTSVGSTAMLAIPNTISQPVLTIIFSRDQKAGEIIEVSNSKGDVILSFTPKKTYPVAMLSSPEFKVGAKYTVSINGEKLFTTTIKQTSITVDEDGNEKEANFMGGKAGPDGKTGRKPGKP